MTHEKRLSRCRNTFSADDKGRECVFTDWIPLMVDDLNTLHQNYTIFLFGLSSLLECFFEGEWHKKREEDTRSPSLFGGPSRTQNLNLRPYSKLTVLRWRKFRHFASKMRRFIVWKGSIKRRGECTRHSPLLLVDHQGLEPWTYRLWAGSSNQLS